MSLYPFFLNQKLKRSILIFFLKQSETLSFYNKYWSGLSQLNNKLEKHCESADLSQAYRDSQAKM